MATVEELREKVLRYKAGEYVGRDIEDGYTTEDICIVHTDDLDSLIAAAEEEGCDDGWVATKMLWQRMQKWNEEWQKENPKERSMTLLDAMDLIEWKIAAAREEGRAEGAEKVKTNLEAWLLREGNEDVTVTHYTSTYTARHINVQAVIDFLHDRVLAPAPKEEGK